MLRAMSTGSIKDFQQLNAITSFYRPPSSDGRTATESESSAPGLIIICSWMGAAPKHIAKYTSGYQRLFPNASILLIESTLAGAFTLSADLSQACKFVEAHRAQVSSNKPGNESHEKISIHAYSNGGCINVIPLADRLRRTHGRVPFNKIILDCCPGKPELASGTRAISFSLPNNYLIKFIGYYIIWICLLMYKLVNETLRIESSVASCRSQLNDPETFDRSTPRLYLYSEADALVRSEHVHEHAEAARQIGYVSVKEERFTTAPHCALLNEDSERYWNAVKAHVQGR